MFKEFNEDARKVIVGAKKIMKELKHPYIGSEHLVLSILKNDDKLSKKLSKYGLNYNSFYKEIIDIIGVGSKESDWFLYTPLLRRVLENAIEDSRENNNGIVTPNHLFASLLEEGEGVAIRIIIGMNIDVDDLYSDFSYKVTNYTKNKNSEGLIEEFGTDLTRLALKKELDPVVGREEELNRIIEILSRRTKNNPILTGVAGVGKTAIVEELARLIAFGEVPISLKNKRIISLDMATMVAGTKYRGEFEDRMRKLLKEVENNKDIILFIDEIHTLVGAGGAEGAIDAANIFKPALSRNKIRCIGATTTDEYKKFIEQDSALERRFQRLYVGIPNLETVRQILVKLKPIYEQYHLVKISDEIIDLIINLGEKYIFNRNNPDKSIDILDEVCAKASLKENKKIKNYKELNKELKQIINDKKNAIMNDEFAKAFKYKEKENILMNKVNRLELEFYTKDSVKEVTKEDVALIINQKTKIPVYELLNNKKEIIYNMEKEINSKIIGQKMAKKEIINVLRRIKLGFKDERCYSFLFCGPSGVGKTELSKLFGKLLVGKENIIKLDMSEFSEAHSVSKFVGAPPGYVGYQDNNHIFDMIRNNPHSVLILDEIEKANSSIINLLFQILEDGIVKDSNGNEINFKHTIIIMTSNIGFNEHNIGFEKNEKSKTITKLKEYFSIPFINRIDNIIIFNSLTMNEVEELIDQKLNNLITKYKKSILVNISSKVNKQILDCSNYQEFGARRLDKIIKDKVEEQIIDALINEQKEVKISKIKEYSTI